MQDKAGLKRRVGGDTAPSEARKTGVFPLHVLSWQGSLGPAFPLTPFPPQSGMMEVGDPSYFLSSLSALD